MDLENNLYFNNGNFRIRKINAITGKISTVAGNGGSGFTGESTLATSASIVPAGFCYDAAGNLFIADDGNRRVRKIDAVTGIISTIAGTGSGATIANLGDGGQALAAKFGSV